MEHVPGQSRNLQHSPEPSLAAHHAIVRLGRTNADTSALEKALRTLGAPLAVLDVPDDAPRQVYGHDLLLLRPDLHVVWRGNQPPEDPGNVAATVTGYGESDTRAQATLRFSG